MKKLFGLLLLLTLLLGACSSENGITRIPKQFLSDVDGKYRFLVVHQDGDGMKNPAFLRQTDNLGQILTGGSQLFLKTAKETYPTLGIEEAPYYVFFDTKGIVYKTNKESKASSFLKDKLNEK